MLLLFICCCAVYVFENEMARGQYDTENMLKIICRL